MSRIEDIKCRLGGMFLRDRGNVDEQTENLIKSEVKHVLEQYLVLKDFGFELKSRDADDIVLTVWAKGKRLFYGDSK